MIRSMKNENGFTLIELLITANIIGVLSAIAMYSSLTYLERARERITKENLRTFRQAISMYNLDTGEYPPKLVDGIYYHLSPKKTKANGGRGGGNVIQPYLYPHLRKIPNNEMPGENDDHPPNWVTQFEDADTATYNASFAANWDGWFYFYKINGETVGLLVMPRSGNDLEGIPYKDW